jgi:DNA (cytosine-5)-methyltransferase 1
VTLTIGSLFSGIGGLELGLERAGLGPVKWQVEQNEHCRAVLARHWPDATRHEDVRHVGRTNLVPVDVVCGGFPCQDLSWANAAGMGLGGERSGLWWEYARIIREIRPRYVAIENVAALLTRGLDVILGELARIGYDAEWSVVSACSVGAPHVRRRLLIVAYANSEHGRSRLRHSAPYQDGSLQTLNGRTGARAGWRARLANPSALYGGADGIRDGMERNHAIGNAVVPQVAEVIGRVILERERLLQGVA